MSATGDPRGEDSRRSTRPWEEEGRRPIARKTGPRSSKRSRTFLCLSAALYVVMATLAHLGETDYRVNFVHENASSRHCDYSQLHMDIETGAKVGCFIMLVPEGAEVPPPPPFSEEEEERIFRYSESLASGGLSEADRRKIGQLAREIGRENGDLVFSGGMDAAVERAAGIGVISTLAGAAWVFFSRLRGELRER
ncbi:hypothetical protein ACF1B4_03145 [Streptomyces albidoflavus]